jgi:hypothetical protein
MFGHQRWFRAARLAGRLQRMRAEAATTAGWGYEGEADQLVDQGTEAVFRGHGTYTSSRRSPYAQAPTVSFRSRRDEFAGR